MGSYGFYFRPSERRGEHRGRLYLRVMHEGQSRSVTTSYRIMPDEWDGAGRQLIIPDGNSERSRLLSDYEGSMICDLRRMNVIIEELEKEGRYTVDDIMYRYHSIIFGNTLEIYAGSLADELERYGYERTARAYRTAAARVTRFNGGRDIKMEHITVGMINDFQQALKAEGKSMNTVSFYMRTIRAICNKATEEGRIQRRIENPFAGVYTGVSPSRKLALTSGELALLSELDSTFLRQEFTEPLQQALAMFLFCYYARGMCFVDMAHLKKSDIKGDTIYYRRKKTGQMLEVMVLPAMRRILDRFARIGAGEYLFPVITNPYGDLRLQYESGLSLQNQRLKKIAAMAGIGKKISTHCARHSWATVAKNEGLPLAVISEGLGHASQKTTEIYLASLEQSVLDWASIVVSRAITPGRRMGDGRKRNRSPAACSYGYSLHRFRYDGYN